ncbi:MAG: hypothetical protein NW215_07350 [Hyphomicrobiales bacterium]|nr:hypothetical protein [Hyphomicrobiales bacterium]
MDTFNRTMSKTVPTLGLFMAVVVSPVLAQEFTINELSFEKGELEIQNNGFVISDAPKGDDEDDGATRLSHQLSIQYGLTNYFLVDFDIGVRRLDGADLEASSAALEGLLKFYSSSDNMFFFGVFGGVEFALQEEDADSFEFGTRFQYGGEESDKLGILSMGLEKTFGENREDGMEFAYGLILRKSVTKTVSLGVEAFGEIEDVGNAPRFEDQDHRVGPVIHFAGGGGDDDDDAKGKGEDSALEDRDVEWGVNLGVLFGITEATPDTTFTWNVELTF